MPTRQVAPILDDREAWEQFRKKTNALENMMIRLSAQIGMDYLIMAHTERAETLGTFTTSSSAMRSFNQRTN